MPVVGLARRANWDVAADDANKAFVIGLNSGYGFGAWPVADWDAACGADRMTLAIKVD